MTNTGFAPCLAALMACLCVACTATGPGSGRSAPLLDGPGSVRAPTGQSLTPQAAADMLTIGKSSKAEVAAALGGRAIVIPFDSGYEVWVYRWPGPDKTSRAATELVLLFEPSGLVKKLRLRPGYATGH